MNLVATPTRVADARLGTGVRLRYAEQGDAGGRPVILLHGYTDSSFSFSRVMPLLDPAYHVYALDLRGHGDSERPPGGYALSDFSADVLAFMDARGLERATLVGHCMGSLVAQRVALDAPARVARLVLVSSMTAARNIEGVEELRQAVEALEGPVPAEFAREFQAGTVYARLPEEFMDGVVAESLKVPSRVWRAALAGLLDEGQASRLGRIETPTLLLWGDRDALLTRAEQDALTAALPNADLTVYTETGHSPHWERPEQFVRDLEAFLARA
ncbi:MAG TPA: alpha/beta fold hydrolase [Pyrinomonadaceae bacterium]|nr:alpha/beta fold hydrolase [Pyrinomonadaceae bacterium]